MINKYFNESKMSNKKLNYKKNINNKKTKWYFNTKFSIWAKALASAM